MYLCKSLILRDSYINSAKTKVLLGGFVNPFTVYHTTINSVRSWKLNFDQFTASNTPSESYLYRYLNGFNPIKIS